MDDPAYETGFETAALSSDDAAEVQKAEELLDAVQQDAVAKGGNLDPRIAQAATILEGLAPEGPEPSDEY
jgi:hypothetical protein